MCKRTSYHVNSSERQEKWRTLKCEVSSFLRRRVETSNHLQHQTQDFQLVQQVYSF